MTRLKAALFLLLLWAAIYLPGLGSTELKGEEGRRILPAVTMLETGQWLVPYVGGKPFLRKPPLVNWAIAASFWITGVRNEWTARLPSALCVLALGLAIVATSGAGWLKVETAFAAAVLAMTQIGLLAKARFAGAEIEGIYAPLSGIAIVVWLAGWSRAASPWLFWTVSGVFLGLASLAKGPSLHLLFFYLLVIAVIWGAARGTPAPIATLARHFFHPAHFAGLAISVGLFAAWAVPYFQTPEARDAAQVWKRQGIDRFTEAEITAGGYALNVPRALADQLPWLLLAPVLVLRLRRSGTVSNAGQDGPATILPRLVSVAAVTALVLLLIPGTLPRYILPLGVVFALAFAWAVEGRGLALRRWLLVNRFVAGFVLLGALAAPLVAGYPLESGGRYDVSAAVRAGAAATLAVAVCALIFARRAQSLTLAWLAGASAALLGAVMLLYAGAAIRWINRQDDLRPLAAQIDAALPPSATVTLYDPGYQAWIFYLRSPIRYATSLEAIPQDAAAVIARGGEKTRRKFAADRPDLAVAQSFRGKTGAEFLLLLPR